MRMQMRRFPRLTNAFSKKIENQEGAIALHYMHDNFVAFTRHFERRQRWKEGLQVTSRHGKKSLA